jgi:glucan-binding YG repeat protein
MKKQTKLFTTLSAAALLTIGVSAVSMAAGWDNSTGEWRYLNNDGTEVTDTWKSANGNWFYLGSDGVMATNQLIEDTNNSTTRYYYVDQYGAMVKNTWKAVARDDGDDLQAEYWWYYFGSDGKAYTTKNDSNFTVSKLKTIDGKKYLFNEEGHMMYGWIKEDSQDQNDTDDDAWKDALFFANGWNDGHIQTGWAQITVEDNDETKDYWFNFGSDGKKVGYKDGKRKKINGVYYHFATDGHMLTDWAVGTTSVEKVKEGKTPDATPGQIVYLNGDGSERKNKWVWAVPDEHSNEISDVLQKDYDDDEYSWFYYDKSGSVIANKIKKINGRDYAFDKYGRMVIGFVGENPDKSIVALKKPGDYTKEKYLDTANGVWQYSVSDEDDSARNTLQTGWKLYYFSNDEEKDGAKKKGYQTLSLDDTTAQFYFNTQTGVAENGYVSKINKYCINGYVLAPGDDDDSNYAGVYGSYKLDDQGNPKYDVKKLQVEKVEIAPDIDDATADKAAVLVNKSGSIVKNKPKLKDNSDHYFIVNKDGVVLMTFDSETEYNDFVKYTDSNDKEKKINVSSNALTAKTTAAFITKLADANHAWADEHGYTYSKK